MVQKPEVSIATLSYEREDVCEALIRKLSSMNLNFRYEIVILDNGSKEKYDIKRIPYNCRIINLPENEVVPKARNILVSECKGKYVLMMDDDNEIDEESIVDLYFYLQKHPEIEAVFPKKIDSYKNGIKKEYSYFKKGITGNLLYVPIRENEMLDGDKIQFGSMVYMAKKEYINYDEDFGLNQCGKKGYAIREESSMHAKIKNKVAVPSAVAYHYADKYSGGYSKSKGDIMYWTGYGNALFIKRYLPGKKLRAILWLLTYGIAYSILRSPQVLKGWYDGIRR